MHFGYHYSVYRMVRDIYSTLCLGLFVVILRVKNVQNYMGVGPPWFEDVRGLQIQQAYAVLFLATRRSSAIQRRLRAASATTLVRDEDACACVFAFSNGADAACGGYTGKQCSNDVRTERFCATGTQVFCSKLFWYRK